MKWAIDYFNKFIDDQGVDLYRQDFNIAPFGYWRDADAPDRQGMTENKYIEGYLAYWDALRAAHPGMFIDSCASGGRRNDLETLRRAVPLLRSDEIFEPLGQQGHTYGFASWSPYEGTGQNSLDPYNFRSCMGWSQTACYDVRDAHLDYPGLKKLFTQWQDISPYFLADYYPLTPYSLSEGAWMAWQWNRPEQKDGVIQVFRRAQCGDTNRFRLRGLEAGMNYTVTDIDSGQSQKLTGQQLMDEGISLTIAAKPGAEIYRYQAN